MRSQLAKRCLAVLVAVCLSLAMVGRSDARDYPSRPITLVCCYAAGGDGDLSARLWAEFAEKLLGQPVLVVNKTGGGGVTGTTFAAMARPDGYTLFLAQAGPNIITPLVSNTRYRFDSFKYVARTTIGNCALVVRADAPWNNLEELIRDLKASPNKYSFASPGATTWLSFAMRHLHTTAGVQVKQVEFQGSSQALTSVLGGHADYTFVFPQNYVSQVESGQLKILAIGEHDPRFPEARTFEEQGFTGSYYGWAGIAAPAKVPDEVVAKLEKVTSELVKDPAFVEKAGNIAATPSYLGSKDWMKALKQQEAELSVLLKETKM